MVSEIKAEDMIAKADPRPTGSDRVGAVTPLKAVQNLPDGGKDLPARKQATDTEAQAARLDDAVKAMNDRVQQFQRELQFSIDKDSGRTVIKVLDMETKEVIRQIPNDEALNFARKLSEGADLEIIDFYT